MTAPNGQMTYVYDQTTGTIVPASAPAVVTQPQPQPVMQLSAAQPATTQLVPVAMQPQQPAIDPVIAQVLRQTELLTTIVSNMQARDQAVQVQAGQQLIPVGAQNPAVPGMAMPAQVMGQPATTERMVNMPASQLSAVIADEVNRRFAAAGMAR